MTAKTFAFLAAAAAACAAGAGEFSSGGVSVEWGGTGLKVSTAKYERTWEGRADRLAETGFRLKGSAGGAGLLAADGGKAEKISVEAKAAKRSVVGADGVEIKVSGKFGERTFWAFAGVAGVLEEGGTGGGARAYRFASRHLKFTTEELRDRTDNFDELRFPREQMFSTAEKDYSGAGCVWSVEESATGRGVAFLRISPLPPSRPDPEAADWTVSGRKGTLLVAASPYAVWSVAYSGGARGRTAAYHSMQRAHRTYVPGRDGTLVSNTWGDRNRDSRINAEFMMREVEAGAEIGVDAIQIDDGWQKGRSANSTKQGTGKKVWNAYWEADPRFWDADPARFPEGLGPIARAAAEKGMRFGLWFGPDSSNDASNWAKDADHLVGLWKMHGIRYFKIDSMKSHSPLALKRQRAFFDRMLGASGGEMTFDLDVTAEIRPGYFGLPDIGTIFVENRYAAPGRLYWPHRTLRNLWNLSHAIDPVRMRMEFLNPLKNLEPYGGDALAPAEYPPETLFACVMTSSPLGWFENSGVGEETKSAWGKLVRTWEKERDAYLTGNVQPVGSAPDGAAWTGFASDCGGGSGYALLFRELNEKAEFTLDLAGLVPGAAKAEAIAGHGSAKVEAGRLAVRVERPLGFVWAKLSK